MDSPFVTSEEAHYVKRPNYMTIPGSARVTRLVRKHPTTTYAVIAVVVMILVLSVVIMGASIGAASSSRPAVCTSSPPPLLIISLDGFRNDYLDRDLTPNILSLTTDGVHAQYMTPVFPSLTFPSHYSIVTGLYPESHGIVSNYFYDRNLSKSFSMKSTESEWWLGEPIWVTAKKQKLRAFTYFWPGSEAEIQGIRPDVYFKYNGSVPFSDRVNTVLGWIDLPNDQRPQLMTLYFNEPDHAAHIYGPNSTQVNSSLTQVDDVIGQLINGLKSRGAYDCVNIMLLTDHGMATVLQKDVFSLGGQLLPTSVYNQYKKYPYFGVFSNLYAPDPNNQTFINMTYNTLKQNIASLGAPFDVYLRDEAPPEYHIGKFNKKRYGNIFIIARTGSYLKKTNTSIYTNKGTHGYNNNDSLMRSIFIARGPSFKRTPARAPFENVQLYNLMCTLLKITPAPNNGTAGALNSLLVDSRQ